MKEQSGCTTYLILIAVGALIYLALLTTSAAAAFARNGGQANLFSPHSVVDVQGNNEGAIISIVGDKNSAEISMDPSKTEPQSKAGAWVMLAMWVLLLVGIVMLIRGKMVKYSYI